MDIKTPRDVGREARACRRFRMLKQSDVARACGVSGQWVSALESGKATLELGLVLRACAELGIDLSAKRADDQPRWTVVLTADAEMREARSLNARRRRRANERWRERAIKAGGGLARAAKPEIIVRPWMVSHRLLIFRAGRRTRSE